MNVCCSECGTVTQGEFPSNVTQDVQYGSGIAAWPLERPLIATYAHVYQLLPLDRTTELIEDITKRRPSEGTVVNMVNDCAEMLAPVEAQIKAGVKVALRGAIASSVAFAQLEAESFIQNQNCRGG